MPYYKDTENNLHFLSTQDIANGGENYLPPRCVEVEAPAPVVPTLDELKAAKNAEARAYLASTDWYAIRKTETGVEIPADILAARQAARDAVK